MKEYLRWGNLKSEWLLLLNFLWNSFCLSFFYVNDFYLTNNLIKVFSKFLLALNILVNPEIFKN